MTWKNKIKLEIPIEELLEFMGIKQFDDIMYGFTPNVYFQDIELDDVKYWLPKKYQYLESEIDNDLTSWLFPDAEKCSDVMSMIFMDAIANHEYWEYEVQYHKEVLERIEDHISNLSDCCADGKEVIEDYSIDWINGKAQFTFKVKHANYAINSLINGDGMFYAEERAKDGSDIEGHLHWLFDVGLLKNIWGAGYGTRYNFFEHFTPYSSFNQKFFEERLDIELNPNNWCKEVRI